MVVGPTPTAAIKEFMNKEALEVEALEVEVLKGLTIKDLSKYYGSNKSQESWPSGRRHRTANAAGVTPSLVQTQHSPPSL